MLSQSTLGVPYRHLSLSARARLARAAGAEGTRCLSLRRTLALEAAFSSDAEGRARSARMLGPSASVGRLGRRLARRLRALRAPADPFEAVLCAHAYGWSFTDLTAFSLYGPYPPPAPEGDLIGVWRSHEGQDRPGLLLCGFASEQAALGFWRSAAARIASGEGGHREAFAVRAASLVVIGEDRDPAAPQTLQARASVCAFLADALGLEACALGVAGT